MRMNLGSLALAFSASTKELIILASYHRTPDAAAWVNVIEL